MILFRHILALERAYFCMFYTSFKNILSAYINVFWYLYLYYLEFF